MVVMTPATRPIWRWSTWATGARQLVVHDVDHRGINVFFARRGHHHAAGAAGDVQTRLGLAGEQAGALQDRVDTQRTPGKLGRIALREYADAIAVDHHGIP